MWVFVYTYKHTHEYKMVLSRISMVTWYIVKWKSKCHYTIFLHITTRNPKSGVDLWFLASTIILQTKMQTYIPLHYNKLVSIKYRAIGPTNMPKCVELFSKVQGLVLAIFYFWYLLPCVWTRSIGSYEALFLPSSTFDTFFHVYELDQ